MEKHNSIRTALHNLPTVLVLTRFVLSPLIWWSVFRGMSPWWFIAGFVTADGTDIPDGTIARRLGVATAALRLADGWVDTWLYLWVVATLWTTHFDTLQRFAIPISILLVLQVSEWIYGRIKFGKPTSYHAWLAKAWGISLFFAIFSVMIYDTMASSGGWR